MVKEIDKMRVETRCNKDKVVECINELEKTGKQWINKKRYDDYLLLPYFDINLINDEFEVEYIVKVKECIEEF